MSHSPKLLPSVVLRLSFAAASLAVERVELTVTERLGVTRVGEAITSGVPLPKGALEDISQCRLLRDGKEVPAQFRAAGLWRPTQSIRWVLLDTQADLAAGKRAKYVLEYGEGVTATAGPTARVRVAEDDGAFTVDTGAATFRISKRRFSLFEEVKLADGRVGVAAPNGKPRFGATLRGLRAMVTRTTPSPKNTGRSHLVFVKYDGKATPDRYTLTFTGESAFEVAGKASGPLGTGAILKDFTSSDGAITILGSAWLRYAPATPGDVYTFRTIAAGTNEVSEGVFSAKVIESGPMRSVLRVKGSFGPADAPAMEFTARYHFHAGSTRVRVQFTLENNDFGGRTNTGNANNVNIGGINCIFFDEMALALPTDGGGSDVRELRLGAAADARPLTRGLDGTIELYQDSNGGARWDRYKNPKYHPRPNSYVTFKGYKLYSGEEVVATGERAIGWIDVSAKDRGVTVAIRDFWQQFPKALAASGDGTVKIGLFPGRYAGDFGFRSGEHKTHEILFDFHRGAADPDRGEAVARAFNDPLRLECSPQWFARTRVLGDIQPFDMDGYKAYEIRNLSAIGVFGEGVRKGPSIFSRREQNDMYGWMDYGDVSMDFESSSGQWGMKYDLDLQMARQYARSGDPKWWKLFAAATRHHRNIDVHHQPHYPYVHYVKGGSWAHSQHNEPGNVNPNRNRGRFTKDLCFGALGGAAAHYLTGNWKARETVLEQAENALARYMSVQKDPRLTRNRLGWRGDACTLNRLMAGYMISGDERFLERARWTIRDCRFDGKSKEKRPVSLWSSTFYMMALARYLEAFPDDADAKKWLLAHIETLYKSCYEKDGVFQGMMYRITPQPDGSVKGSGQCSHYNIMASDALTIGYRLSGQRRYLDMARKCFAYGVRNACWVNGPPTYASIHSANGGTHGQFFMVEDTKMRATEE